MSSKEVIYGAGRTLFKQGEKGGELYFINSGQVALTVRDELTGDEIEIAVLGPKTVLGTMSFLESEPRSATATTKTEVSYVKITQMHRDKLLSSIPSWMGVLLKDLSMSLRRLNSAHVSLNSEHKKLEKHYQLTETKKKELENDLESLQEENKKIEKASNELEKTLRNEIKELKSEIISLKKSVNS